MWVYFDVCDTLIIYEDNFEKLGIASGDPNMFIVEYLGQCYTLYPYIRHIEDMKKHHDAGDTIVVWSAGGQNWAQLIVDTLKLNSMVSHVLTKPDVYYDDLSCREWMPLERRYREFKKEEKI